MSCASSVSLFSFWKAQWRVLIGTGRRRRVPWASVVVIGFFFCFCFFVFDVREMSETWFIEEVKHQRGISSQGERMI